jgi:benzoyl-CoA reductase/2-hydroxyglutaryl-CoA dehydratase subunit BcrC/BadD/HgdB
LSDSSNKKIEVIIRACRLMLRMNQASPDARKSDIFYYKMIETYYRRLLEAHDNGKLIAAHTDFFPAELIYAMDYVPMATEVTTWMLALFTGENSDILSASAEVGLAPEICTPHRGIIGAFASKSLPYPDVILWSNMVCDNTAKTGELVTKITGAPGFFLDHPFKDSEAEFQYLVGELGDMIEFLQHKSGRRIHWDHLAEIVARMDRQISLIREINELRKAVPTPFSPLGFLQLLTADYLFPGQPEAIEYLEALRDELAAMVKAGKGAVPKERFRLMSFFLPPMYLTGFLNRIAVEYGAVSVVEPFFTFWGEGHLNPAKPLEGVAKKSYMIPEMRMYGPLDNRAIDAIRQCAKDYKVDGAVYWADVGCRHSCATIKLFKDVLEEIDIPVVTIDCDVVDPTVTSEFEVRARLEQFFEMLEDR